MAAEGREKLDDSSVSNEESHPQGTEWAGLGRAGQSVRWGAASTGGWNRRWKDWKDRHMVPASTVSGGFPSKEAAQLGSPSNSILSIFQRTGHARDADGREHLRQGGRGPRGIA